MAEKLYRIKLYGYSGDNPEAFARSMAALVSADPGDVLEWLKRPPVTVKEGLPKEKADTIVEAINILRGLCLAEPVDAEPGDEAMARLAELSMMRQAEAGAYADKFDSLFSRPRTWLIVGGVVILLLIAISISLLGGRDAAENVNTVDRPALETPKDGSVITKYGVSEARPYAGWSEPDLLREYEAIQNSIKEMKIELQLHQRDLRRLSSTYGANREHIESRRQKLGRLRWRIRVAGQELEMLKTAILEARRRNRRR
jgi:hypothetical protein